MRGAPQRPAGGGERQRRRGRALAQPPPLSLALLALLIAAVCSPAAAEEQPGVLVVYRVAGRVSPCSKNMIRRMRDTLRGVAEVNVMYDPGIGSRKLADAEVREQLRQFEPVPVHVLTSEDALQAFPNMQWPLPCLHPVNLNPRLAALPLGQSQCREARPGRWRQGWFAMFRDYALSRFGTQNLTQLVNFFIYEPTIVVLWRRLNPRPRQLWIVEEDVGMGITTVRRFFEKHSRSSADYFAVPAEGKFNDPQLQDMSYVHRANAAMMKTFPKPYRKWDHVQGYSTRMMERLGKVLDSGMAAHGELFSGTVCRSEAPQLGTCVFDDIGAYVHPSQRCYASNDTCNNQILRSCASADPKVLEDSCKQDWPEYFGRWLHPIKNWCQFSAYQV
eukprot:TRINITY_DN55057_c0_g1_i1.p1 TRINITY_DN55057_c0_g1~~TRINITY_DN55057_c0_g1_i1.p1  ORF type:complete len:418 (+),score=129.65 TRINITY_DN55057_c0_g1_i1:88-1254(+)